MQKTRRFKQRPGGTFDVTRRIDRDGIEFPDDDDGGLDLDDIDDTARGSVLERLHHRD